MPRNTKVDAETRTRAVVLVEEGYSYRDVGTRLGISHKTVFRLVKKYRETGSIVDKPRSGRPRVTTEREDRVLVRRSLGDHRLTSPELRAKMEDDHGVHVSSRTVRSRLFSAGLRGCVAAKKPLLRDPTICKRLAFAREHRNWTIEQWNSVLWADESSFQLFCGAKRAYVRRRVGEKYSRQCIVPTVKHGGGSLMIWGTCRDSESARCTGAKVPCGRTSTSECSEITCLPQQQRFMVRGKLLSSSKTMISLRALV